MKPLNVFNQTDEELEQRLKDHKRKMWQMLLVFIVVMTLNVLFVLGIACYGPALPSVQILISTPLCVINCLSIWWLGLGGRWQ
jgi:hypothetical protein